MPESTSQGGLGIRISQIPSGAENVPNSGIYIVTRLLPSTTNSQRLEVTNSTTKAMHVSIYPGPAEFTNGTFRLLAQGSKSELVSWTSVSPGVIDLAPMQSSEVTVTIKVPSVVTSGEDYGVIWAAVASPASPFGVVSVNRVGIRMYTPVGSATSSSAPAPSIPSTHHTLEFQWLAIGLLALAVCGLAYRELPFVKRQRKERKRALRKLERR